MTELFPLSYKEQEELRDLESSLFTTKRPANDSASQQSAAANKKRAKNDPLGLRFTFDEPQSTEEPASAYKVGDVIEPRAASQSAAVPKPAWHDSSVADVAVDLASAPRLKKLRSKDSEREVGGSSYEAKLRNFHRKLHPGTGWAKLAKEDRTGDVAGDSTWSSSPSGAPIRATVAPTTIPPHDIHTQRLRDANAQHYADAVISALQFHPTQPLLMVGSMDKSVRLFNIDGDTNQKVQSLHFSRFPVRTAAYVLGGEAIVATSRRPELYVYHMTHQRVEFVKNMQGVGLKSLESCVVDEHTPGGGSMLGLLGPDGSVELFDLKNRAVVGRVKFPGTVRAASFLKGGMEICGGGSDGNIYIFDIRTQRIKYSFCDSGQYNCTALAIDPSTSHLVTGSQSGIVHLHDATKMYTSAYDSQLGDKSNGIPKIAGPRAMPQWQPRATLKHMTTEISNVHVNHDAQLMAMYSATARDALRLVHLPTATVYRNWPTSGTPLHYVTSAAFSSNSKLFVVGNARGRVLLYRINHYT